MTFWDSSGLVPLLLDEPGSPQAREWLDRDPEIVVWWATPLELRSAAARLRREEVLDLAGESAVLALIAALEAAWTEVLPTEEVRKRAGRLLRVHPLRAADAFQLAAALVWSGIPDGHTVVTLDERLALAAQLEGFTVLPACGSPSA